MNAGEILKVYFGYDSFKEGQESIINTIMEGRDALAIMPTGAGKSICYQIPALLLPGVTIVISPLISLMQDQVKALNEAGIHAAYINSSLSEAKISKALENAGKGAYKIIYVAPERLESQQFSQFAAKVKISMVTVDEAHCISQWGQDFRPSYLKIVEFVKGLPHRPIISAFTATATEEVKDDITCILDLKNPNIVVTGFDRGNLYYRVESIKGKDAFVIDYIENHPGESGIIYCATRKNVDSLYDILLKNKTLIDMCVKAPKNKEEMLNVSGVGITKFEKYGQRFLDEISAYQVSNPGIVLSMEGDENADLMVHKAKKKKGKKVEFYIMPEDAQSFTFKELYFISDVKDELNRITTAENVKKVTVAKIWEHLVH